MLSEFYFAYGSNLCPAQMQNRCPGFGFIAAGHLEDYRLDFPRRSNRWGGGVAGLLPQQGAQVEGALFRITSGHLETLDTLEGISEGRYRRDEVRVVLSDGRDERAHCYFARLEEGGPFHPTPDYLQAMLRGAQHHRLSPAWIHTLRAVKTAVPIPPTG